MGDAADLAAAVALARSLVDELEICLAHGCSGGQLKRGGPCGNCVDGFVGPTPRAVLARALLAVVEEAGHGEHSVLALIDHYQRGLFAAEAELSARRAAELTDEERGVLADLRGELGAEVVRGWSPGRWSIIISVLDRLLDGKTGGS